MNTVIVMVPPQKNKNNLLFGLWSEIKVGGAFCGAAADGF